MKPEVRIALETLLTADRERFSKIEQCAKERASKEAAALAHLMEIRDTVVRPAILEISATMAQFNWACQITYYDEGKHPDGSYITPQAGIFFIRNAPYAQKQKFSPHISVMFDKVTPKIHISGYNLAGNADIDENIRDFSLFTQEYVQNRIVNFLEKVFPFWIS